MMEATAPAGRRARSAAAGIALAADPGYSAEVMLDLAADRPTVQRALADNPQCTPEALAVIVTTIASRPTHGWVVHHTLRAVGEHRATPPHVLAALAHYHRVEVRAAVARNPSTPTAVLNSLVESGGLEETAGVAANPATSRDRLATLSRHRSPIVRLGAAANPSVSDEDLVRLVADPSIFVRAVATACLLRRPWSLVRRAMLAHGEGTRRRVIEGLSAQQMCLLRDDPDRYLRAALASATDDPATLTVLAADPALLVRRRAGRRILASLQP